MLCLTDTLVHTRTTVHIVLVAATVLALHTGRRCQASAATAQTPAEQVSPDVHATPSLQGSLLNGFSQPVAGLHMSSVQALPSPQSIGSNTHPLTSSQLSVVHRLTSSQMRENGS